MGDDVAGTRPSAGFAIAQKFRGRDRLELLARQYAVTVGIERVEELACDGGTQGCERLAVDVQMQTQMLRSARREIDEVLCVVAGFGALVVGSGGDGGNQEGTSEKDGGSRSSRCQWRSMALRPPTPGPSPSRGEGRKNRQPSRGSRRGLHARASLIGFAFGSMMRIGRPTLETFCLVGSMPRPPQIVARKSPTPTGRSATDIPSGAVLPIA